MKTRNFAAAVAASIAMTAAANAQETFEMTSAFGKNLPILGTGAVKFAEKINAISDEVEFEQFDPGELVPALEALDAVSNGSVDAAFASGQARSVVGRASGGVFRIGPSCDETSGPVGCSWTA